VLIYIRSVYRIVELQGGFSGKVANDQASFMVLEGPMIILAVLALTVSHTGRVFDGLWKLSGQGKRGNFGYTQNGALMDDEQEELTKIGTTKSAIRAQGRYTR